MIEEQAKQIRLFDSRFQRIEHDLDVSRRDANTVRQENAQLRADIASLQNAASATSYHGQPAITSHNHGYAVQSEQQQQLPPLRNIGPEVMNGVQYSHTNGYRADRF